jgi:DNA-binding GntR family transcriptional regulator
VKLNFSWISDPFNHKALREERQKWASRNVEMAREIIHFTANQVIAEMVTAMGENGVAKATRDRVVRTALQRLNGQGGIDSQEQAGVPA